MKPEKQHWRKKTYQKVNLETKILVVDQILSGQISVNFAAKKYNIPRSSIDYWIKKYATLEQKKKAMSKQVSYKRLKKQLNRQPKKAVDIYNNLRPHRSLDLFTPKHVHLNQNINYKSYLRNKKNMELLTF